jgi:hypothetical protein
VVVHHSGELTIVNMNVPDVTVGAEGIVHLRSVVFGTAREAGSVTCVPFEVDVVSGWVNFDTARLHRYTADSNGVVTSNDPSKLTVQHITVRSFVALIHCASRT